MADAHGRFTAIKKHFDEEAKRFDAMFYKIAPYYAEAIRALVSTLPFRKNSRPMIVDLGCGTGNITKAVMERFPKAQVTCVDLAENMIAMARAKLRKYRDIAYWAGDMRNFTFPKGCNAVISSLVMHHVEPKEKARFYRKIRNALPRGGILAIADFVLPSTPHLAAVYREVWTQFMRKSISPAQIAGVLAQHRREDRPAQLLFEIDLLREVGFRNVDVVWKQYNFAVYTGEK